MRSLDGTGLARKVTGGPSGGQRRGPLAAALLGITLLCCLFGPLAVASGAPAAPASRSGLAMAGGPPLMALQQAELTGTDSLYGFGYSVAIDGDTALVGATGGNAGAGAAYVFVRTGGAWTQQQMLTVADGVFFGCSVALFGNAALIGAEGDATTGQETIGAAYLFIRSGGVWTQRQKLTAADGVAGDHFGCSVALIGDKALVGAEFHDVAGKIWEGAAYAFVSARPAWTQEAELTAADGVEYGQFGSSVALSGDTALVGSRMHRSGGIPPYAGAAFVFVRSIGWTGMPAWTQQAELTAADGATSDRFGASVAVDGDTALVGAPDKRIAGKSKAGAAYVFTRFADSWTQQAELTAPDVAAAGKVQIGFGASVALSGATALVGAPGHDRAGKTDAGAAYAYTRSGAMWTQQEIITAGDAGAKDKFGTSVAVSGDTMLVGAPRHYLPAIKARGGAAYVFLTAPTIKSFKPASGPVGGGVTIIGSFLTGATAVAFNGTAAPFIAFGIQITTSVPVGATTGPITVSTPLGVATSATDFTVIPAPAIVKLKPASGKRGATVTITGSGFGMARGASHVKFGGTKCTAYVSWSGALIKCKVPAAASYGSVQVTVTTRGGESNAMSFKVRKH